MSIDLATWIVSALAAYAALGLAFAVAFVTVGVGRVDATARTGTLGFRLLILPGAAALWPLLALRWARGGGEPPEERTPHRVAARRAPSPDAGRGADGPSGGRAP